MYDVVFVCLRVDVSQIYTPDISCRSAAQDTHFILLPPPRDQWIDCHYLGLGNAQAAG